MFFFFKHNIFFKQFQKQYPSYFAKNYYPELFLILRNGISHVIDKHTAARLT